MKSNEELEKYRRLMIEAETELKQIEEREKQLLQELTSLGLDPNDPLLEKRLKQDLLKSEMTVQQLEKELEKLTKEDA